MRIVKLIFALFLLALNCHAQDTRKVILDADTGNEVDDLYAIVRALIEPSWDVLGLNATQWQVSHWATDNTMTDSYRLNDVLLSYLQMNNRVVSNRGAEARLYDWGHKSQTSAASNFIISEAHKTSEGEKITVIAVGALTNVASAILDDPSIQDKISLYWVGSSYDHATGIMQNTDFNSVMDIQALDVILKSEVELHIIPKQVTSQMVFYWEETREKFEGKHDLLDYLLQRWYNHVDGGVRERTLWDLALIQAMIHPDHAEEVMVRTSKERGDRGIWVYKDIDEDFMRQEFFETTLKYLEAQSAD